MPRVKCGETNCEHNEGGYCTAEEISFEYETVKFEFGRYKNLITEVGFCSYYWRRYIKPFLEYEILINGGVEDDE